MRRLRRVLLGTSVVALAVASIAGAYVRGLFVEAHPPGAIDALLAPFDEVYRPAGAGPFPAMVLFHGCGGLRDSIRQWGEQLRDQGVLVVATDSFAGRGLDWQEVCSGRALLGVERAGDVWVSLERVRRMPDVDPDRVALMGWSHGAWSIMELLSFAAGKRPPNLAASPGRPFQESAAAILLYPYCGLAARALWLASRDADARAAGSGGRDHARRGLRALRRCGGCVGATHRDPRLPRRSPRFRPADPERRLGTHLGRNGRRGRAPPRSGVRAAASASMSARPLRRRAGPCARFPRKWHLRP